MQFPASESEYVAMLHDPAACFDYYWDEISRWVRQRGDNTPTGYSHGALFSIVQHTTDPWSAALLFRGHVEHLRRGGMSDPENVARANISYAFDPLNLPPAQRAMWMSAWTA